MHIGLYRDKIPAIAQPVFLASTEKKKKNTAEPKGFPSSQENCRKKVH